MADPEISFVWGARGAEVETRRREDQGAEFAEGVGGNFFNLLLNKMLSYRRETALQGAL